MRLQKSTSSGSDKTVTYSFKIKSEFSRVSNHLKQAAISFEKKPRASQKRESNPHHIPLQKTAGTLNGIQSSMEYSLRRRRGPERNNRWYG